MLSITITGRSRKGCIMTADKQRVLGQKAWLIKALGDIGVPLKAGCLNYRDGYQAVSKWAST
jgi:hypothetical protein